MSNTDLMKLLNLKPSDPTPSSAQEEGGGGIEEEETVSTDSALVLDDWDRAKGEKLLTESRLKEQVSPIEMADYHTSVYTGDPKLVEKCADERRHEFLKTLMETPEYKSLHDSTRYNELASEMACYQIADQYTALHKKDEDREKKLQGKEGDPTAQKKAERQASRDCIKAVGTALREAKKEVKELEDTQHALGMGTGGTSSSTLDTEKIAQTFQRVRNNGMLRRIIDRAGAFRRFAQGKQRQKVTHGYEDMVGICLDDDLSHLLDEEVVTLLDPDLELDALRRLSGREMLAHDYRGVEKVGKGPIVACIDGSGSMSGPPIESAKGFALSVAWVARFQKRWCCLIEYSGSTQGKYVILPPNKWDESALLDWLGHFFGGGTDMDVPLDLLPNKWWAEFIARGLKRGKTDLFLLTDAICHVPDKMREDFLAWKKREQVRCITLLVNTSRPGDLAFVSDEVHNVDHTVSTKDKGIEVCLSI